MKTYRVMFSSEWGLYIVERRLLWFLWWPVFKTYSIRGASAYTEMLGAVYNEQTTNYEVHK